MVKSFLRTNNVFRNIMSKNCLPLVWNIVEVIYHILWRLCDLYFYDNYGCFTQYVLPYV